MPDKIETRGGVVSTTGYCSDVSYAQAVVNTPWGAQLACDPGVISVTGDTMIFAYRAPYRVGLEADLFIIDNTIHKERFISKYTRGDPLPVSVHIPLETEGFLTTQVKRNGRPSFSLEPRILSYSQWGDMLVAAQNGEVISDGDGIFLYGWVQGALLQPLTSDPADNSWMDSGTVLIRKPNALADLIRNPQNILYKGVSIWADRIGAGITGRIKEKVLSPEFLQYMFYGTAGVVGTFTALHALLPSFAFWKVVEYSVYTGTAVGLQAIHTTITFVAPVVEKVVDRAVDTFIGTTIAVGGVVVMKTLALGEKAVKITYPVIRILRDRFGKPKPDGCGRVPLDSTDVDIGDYPKYPVYPCYSGSSSSSSSSCSSTVTPVYAITSVPGEKATYSFGGFSIEFIPVPVKQLRLCADPQWGNVSWVRPGWCSNDRWATPAGCAPSQPTRCPDRWTQPTRCPDRWTTPTGCAPTPSDGLGLPIFCNQWEPLGSGSSQGSWVPSYPPSSCGSNNYPPSSCGSNNYPPSSCGSSKPPMRTEGEQLSCFKKCTLGTPQERLDCLQGCCLTTDERQLGCFDKCFTGEGTPQQQLDCFKNCCL